VSSHVASQAVTVGASSIPEKAGMSIFVVMVGIGGCKHEEDAMEERGVAGFNGQTAGGVLSTDLAHQCQDGACSGSKRGRALAAVVFHVKWVGDPA